jgi:hypothetical protein
LLRESITHTINTKRDRITHREKERISHPEENQRDRERKVGGGNLPRDDDELLREERSNLVAMAIAAPAAPANAISFCFMAPLLLLLLFLLLLSWYGPELGSLW